VHRTTQPPEGGRRVTNGGALTRGSVAKDGVMIAELAAHLPTPLCKVRRVVGACGCTVVSVAHIDRSLSESASCAGRMFGFGGTTPHAGVRVAHEAWLVEPSFEPPVEPVRESDPLGKERSLAQA
jgi:hypothetical protein